MARTTMSPGSHWPRTSTLRGCRTNRLLRMFLLFGQTLIGLSVLSTPLQAFAFGSLGTNSAVRSSSLRLLEPRALSIHEMNMTRSTASREGQPVVAINPTNPDNSVFVSTRFYPLPELEPVGGCFLTYTLDRGTTWNNVTVDFPLGATPKCGEPQVFVDANGTFYLLNNQVFSDLEDNIAAHLQLSKSIDGGKTWSVPSVTALHMQGATKLRVDVATGKVSDGGKTWAAFNQIPGPMDVCLDYQIPDPPPICGFPGRSIVVHDSTLASAAEGSKGHPEIRGNFVANGTGPMLAKSGIGLPSDPTPWVSADPTSTGRFALMVPRDFTLEFYIIDTAGERFTGPAVIQTPNAQRPAFDFGPNGLLGVMWRTNSSSILDVSSTVSFDSGRNFAAPIKVTAQPQPVGQNGQPGDRASFVSLTHTFAYVV
ncbi:uncharacterized protein CCOS01_06363 [Colletotrichum costaricense]|uniref:Exo-alpha-sialidase n=1 Tax=Colletotrichum costaricense TaxID=1209916 RepID=A0AAI9YY96_9PEZI|nr:uncharacterized protein CCOS01_06363 [Colletotrichum costaricense]KAK1528529.1 hypothetical protein CCOS01_06363 [Colletotrichum costaricense]